MFRTAQWCVVRKAPRYVLAGGGSKPSPARRLTDTLSPRERVGIMCARTRKQVTRT